MSSICKKSLTINNKKKKEKEAKNMKWQLIKK